jgi:hypothetical protein
MPIDIRPQRANVTLELQGAEHIVRLPPRRKGEPKRLLTLKSGDNEVAIADFHEFGHDPVTCKLIADGKLFPVCRTHQFEIDKEHCSFCGHNRDSAAEAAAAPAKPEPVQPQGGAA